MKIAGTPQSIASIISLLAITTVILFLSTLFLPNAVVRGQAITSNNLPSQTQRRKEIVDLFFYILKEKVPEKGPGIVEKQGGGVVSINIRNIPIKRTPSSFEFTIQNNKYKITRKNEGAMEILIASSDGSTRKYLYAGDRNFQKAEFKVNGKNITLDSESALMSRGLDKDEMEFDAQYLTESRELRDIWERYQKDVLVARGANTSVQANREKSAPVQTAEKKGGNDSVQANRKSAPVEVVAPRSPESSKAKKADDAGVQANRGNAPVQTAEKKGGSPKGGSPVAGLSQQDDAITATDKLYPVPVNDNWGYIDRTGKMVVNPQFYKAHRFSDGMALVQGPPAVDFKFGFIDRTGKMVIGLQFRRASYFSEGMASVSSGDKLGYIDRTGKLVIDLWPLRAHASKTFYTGDFSNGMAYVSLDYKWGYIDRTGKVVIKVQFDWAKNFAEGLAAVQVGKQWGYIDRTGNMAIKPQFDDAKDFAEGLAEVQVGKQWGYIDHTGRMILFSTGMKFSDGMARVLAMNAAGNKWGYIDRTGKMVVSQQFDDADDFAEGLAAVQVGKQWGYIDRTGKMVVNPQFYKAESFFNGLALVRIKNNKWGCIDHTGRMIWISEGDDILASGRPRETAKTSTKTAEEQRQDDAITTVGIAGAVVIGAAILDKVGDWLSSAPAPVSDPGLYKVTYSFHGQIVTGPGMAAFNHKRVDTSEMTITVQADNMLDAMTKVGQDNDIKKQRKAWEDSLNAYPSDIDIKRAEKVKQ